MLERLLSSIDLFGIPVLINFSRKQKFNSIYGGMCTLLFFGFIIWILFNESFDLFTRSNPKAVRSEAFEENPRETILSSGNFPFAFGLQAPDSLDYVHYIDESIYRIELYHIRQDRYLNENNTVELRPTFTKIYTETCTPEHFGELSESFALLNLDQLYCVAKHQPELDQIRVQGTTESPVYETVNIWIIQCDNDTSEVTCASKGKMDQYLSGGWFYAYYANTAIDMQNFTRPDLRYKDAYYTMISPDNFKSSYIILNNVNVVTDSGWLIEDKKEQNYIKVEKIEEFLEFGQHPEKVLISVNFDAGKLRDMYSRSYKKIQDVLAGAGGVANAVLIVLFFLIGPYMKIKFYESLINEVFDIGFGTSSLNDKQKMARLRKNMKNKKTRKQLETVEDRDKKTIVSIETVNIDIKETQPQDHKTLQRFESTSIVGNTLLGNKSKVRTEEKLEESKKGKKIENVQIDKRLNMGGKLKSVLSQVETREQFSIENINLNQNQNNTQVTQNQDFDLARPKEVYFLNSPMSSAKTKLINLPLKVVEEQDVEKPKNLSFLSDDNSSGDKNYNIEELRKYESEAIPITANQTERIETEAQKMNTAYKEILTQQKTEDFGNPRRKTNEIEKIELDSQKFNSSMQMLSTLKSLQFQAKKLEIGFWEYFCSFFKRSKIIKEKIELLNQGRKDIEERLDIFNLMSKLRDVDKIRALLFEEDQLVLFNNLPKPEIKLKRLGPVSMQSPIHNSIKRSTVIRGNQPPDRVIDSYDSVKNKEHKTKMDRKLLQIFDETLGVKFE